MISLSDILLVALFFGASALFSGLETGGYLLNRIRLRYRARHRNPSARRLQKVLGDAHRFIFTVLIGNNIANYLLSRQVTQLYLDAGTGGSGERLFGFIPWTAESAATLTLMLPVFLFAELVPKNLFRRQADTLMYRSSGLLLAAERLFSPLTLFLKQLFGLLTGGRGRSEALNAFSLSLQGLREYVSEDIQEGALSDHQYGMINNLVAMHRTTVRDVMKPAASIVSIPEQQTVQAAIALLRECDAEQIAAYRGSPRNLTGLISLFDLIDAADRPQESLKTHVRKVIRLSADLPLTKAFRRLRQKGESVALVTDRTSRTIGLIHLRDIAGYIVSES